MNLAAANILVKKSYDAVVVGSGPNGLAAAVTLAEKGQKVLVIEASPTIGGGTRTQELTLPGFQHDVCSAVHPLGVASPFFRRLPLEHFGLEWIFPPAPLAHPLDGGTAVLVENSLQASAAALGADSAAYRRLFTPLARDANKIIADLFGPVPLPPRHLLATLRFGLPAILPASLLARIIFKTPQARALFAGMAAHAILPLEWPGTAAFGLVMHMLAHTTGWPVARGGSQAIAAALAAYLQQIGGEIVTGWRVAALDELPRAKTVMLDVTPREVLRIAGRQLPDGYRQQLARFHYGPAAFKIDWALDGPVPWTAEACRQTITLHLGGSLEEISAGEREVWKGVHPQNPYVIFSQPSLFDPTRAPQDKHTAWAYCHVPNGSTEDMTAIIENQVERFAPGFRARILARSVKNSVQLEQDNPNYVGGDINSGAQSLDQFFTRPVFSLRPYATPLQGVYLCNSSTPPGGGVHGLCGFHAAHMALRASQGRDFSRS